MKLTKQNFILIVISVLFLGLAVSTPAQVAPASWQGTVRDAAGKAIARAQLELRAGKSGRLFAPTDGQGVFRFPQLPPGDYAVTLHWHNKSIRSRELLKIQQGYHLTSTVQLAVAGKWLVLQTAAAGAQAQASGGEKLSSRQVSELPLNKRDFSQLLLLAAGTMTDTNGSANFTQQFAVNGQRGATAVFAMDGVDMTDPELGGATFYQLQCGRGAGNRVVIRRDAGGNRPRRCRLHQHQDQVRNRISFTARCLNLCATRPSMRAISSIERIPGRSRPHSALPAQ